MHRFRKICLISIVWLTAGSTLIAGTPHFVCRCPDGTTKAFCFGSASPKSCCCHGGQCCCSTNGGCPGQTDSPNDQDTEVPPCCSSKDSASPGKDRNDDTSLDHDCCQRELAQPQAMSAPDSDVKPDQNAIAAAPSYAVHASIETAHTFVPRTWQFHRMPPPTNLVITLLHLVI